MTGPFTWSPANLGGALEDGKAREPAQDDDRKRHVRKDAIYVTGRKLRESQARELWRTTETPGLISSCRSGCRVAMGCTGGMG
jgi:hypothetical protein